MSPNIPSRARCRRRCDTAIVLLISVFQATLGARQACTPPTEPRPREVTVDLRGGDPWVRRLDEALKGLSKKSDARPEAASDITIGGYSEFMEEYLGSWHSFLSDTTKDKKGKKIGWATRLNQLARVVRGATAQPAFLDMYGARALIPAVVGTLWIGKAQHSNLVLPEEQVLFLEKLMSVANGPRKRLARELRSKNTEDAREGCQSLFASCRPDEQDPSKGALLALELRSDRFVWPQDASMEARPFPSVSGLSLQGPGALALPSFWTASLPKLQVLEIRSLRVEDEAYLVTMLESWADTLLGLTIGFDEETGNPVLADRLEGVCVLRALRRLKLDGPVGVFGLPSCLSSLPLVELDVRGTRLRDGQSLPTALGALGPTLVSFIAYSQGRDKRCPSEAPETGPPEWKACRARPSWDPGDWADEDVRAWQCPWDSWVVRLDDPEAPWWKWTQLERFWVDANFFHGTFPEGLAMAWGSMRSLDLQLNEISGPLPISLGDAKNLSALRIHRNRFEGEIPAAIMNMPSLAYTNFEGNTGLTGCVPRPKKRGRHSLELQIQGTSLTGLCSGSKGSKGSKAKADKGKGRKESGEEL